MGEGQGPPVRIGIMGGPGACRYVGSRSNTKYWPSVWAVAIPISLAVLLFALSVFLIFLPAFEAQLLEQKKNNARELAELAISTLEHYAAQVKAGHLSEKDARAEAIEQLRAARYGQRGLGYFWIQTAEPRMVMHPYRPDLENAPLADYADAEGSHLFVTACDLAAHGGGFMRYTWQWYDDDTNEVSKISYVQPFKEWGWIVGTGVYTDDIAVEVAGLRRRLALSAAIPLLLSVLLSAMAVRGGHRMAQARKESLQREIESSRKHTLLFEGAHEALLVVEDDRITDCNARACNIFDYTRGQLIGMSPVSLSSTTQDGREGPEEALRRHLEKALEGFPQQFMWRAKRSDGSEFDADVKLNMVEVANQKFLYIVVDDVSERRIAEEQTRRMALVVEQTSDFVLMSDVEANISYVNPAFEGATGYLCTEILGQPLHSLFCNREDMPRFEDIWHTVQRGGVWRGRVCCLRKDGSIYTADVTIVPLKDEAGEVTGSATLQRDVSREMQFEAQLRQSHKMQALGTLAGGIAHDFNNILAGMIGYASLAQEMFLEDEQAQNYLTEIIRGGDRAGDLIRQILQFSRQSEKLAAAPVKPAPILRECLSMLREALPATIKIENTLGHDCAAIRCDPTQFHQVVMNLCTNACHAMEPAGGILRVALHDAHVEVSGEEANPEVPAGEWVCLEVSDTGTGMDEVTQSRVFDPYFTTKSEGKGTGMGLSIVQGIIQSYGGHIRVQSELGTGTRFRVYFPATSLDDIESETPKEAERPASGRSARVLLIDDEKTVADISRLHLERRGYKVVSFTDPSRALAYFQDHVEDFDIVVTDRTMPRITGEVVAKTVMQRRPALPVILMTGLPNAEAHETTRALGLAGLVPKPFSAKMLDEAILAALEARSLAGPS